MEFVRPAVARAVDPTQFHRVAGHLGAGVIVLTANLGDSTVGGVARSVAILSVDPPMMLACVEEDAPVAEAAARSGRYVVNVLADGLRQVGHAFTLAPGDRSSRASLRTSELGSPLIRHAVAHIECDVTEHLSGRTHSVFLARVMAATADPSGGSSEVFGGGAFDRNDDVYRAALSRVLGRVYVPDQVIAVDDLATQLAVGAGSAFYALTRLATDGLVHRDPDRGYVVAPLDGPASDDLLDARLAIELGVIDSVVSRVSDAELAGLRLRFDQMAAILVHNRFADVDAYLDADRSLHGYIVSLSGSPTLDAAYARLSIQSSMTRSFGLTPLTSERFIGVQRVLTEAFERRDTEAARAAAITYCELAKKRVRAILSHTGGQI